MLNRVVHAGLAGVVIAVFACGRQDARGSESLVVPDEGLTPSAVARIDVALHEFAAARAEVADPGERWALRLSHYQAAQETLRRESVDDAMVMPALGELRHAFMDSEEAREDYAASETERIARGERFQPTDGDLELRRHFAAEVERSRAARTAEVAELRADDIAQHRGFAGTEADQSIPLAAIARGEEVGETPGDGAEESEARHEM